MAGIGCADKNSLPSGILAREDMQNILWDMIQADQYSGYLAKDSGRINLKLEHMRLYDEVFQLHHISRDKFTQSYKYYMANPELTQTLLDSLLTMGNRMRSENYNHPVNRPVTTPPLTTLPAQTTPPPARVPALLSAPKVPASVKPTGNTSALRKADSLHNGNKRRFEAP
jgi:hypothetical protein